MNIILATDDNFVQHCCVTITSVLKNNPETEFYLFTEGLKESNVLLLDNQVQTLGGHLTICKVDSELVKVFPMPAYMSSHISIATYYRLFAARLLPESVEKVIYLDCDIVVTGSLKGMWNFPIEDYALGAVYQSHEHSEENENGYGPHSYTRLGIPREHGYFNAGVLLMNLKYWRENNVTERFFKFIEEHYDLIHAHDQDTLNAVLHSETAVLNPTWNYREHFMTGINYTYPSRVHYHVPIDNPIVIHYVSKPKPWQYFCKHPFRGEYYKYLQYTPFDTYEPKWIWSEYKLYVLKPLFYRILINLDILNIRSIVKRK